MTSALVSFTFNNTKLNTVTIRGKHWTRAVEVCKALKYKIDWPRNSQTEEYYISEEGLFELLFTSQQPKAKDFRKYCFNVMFPQIRQQL